MAAPHPGKKERKKERRKKERKKGRKRERKRERGKERNIDGRKLKRERRLRPLTHSQNQALTNGVSQKTKATVLVIFVKMISLYTPIARRCFIYDITERFIRPVTDGVATCKYHAIKPIVPL